MMKLDDSELTIDVYSAICSACVHFDAESGVRICDAFDDIPLEIWSGKNTHKSPFPGDNGIQFEPIDRAKQ